MSNQLNYDIENNLIVFTRSINKDYDYVCKSPLVKENWYSEKNGFIDMGEKIRIDHLKFELEKTEWFKFSIENGNIFIRVVSDGMEDWCGRPIFRYEGAFLPKNIQYDIPNIIPIIENALDKTQQRLGYGIQKHNEIQNDISSESIPQNLNLIGEIFSDSNGNLWVIKEEKHYKLIDLAGNHLSESNALKNIENNNSNTYNKKY